MEPTDTALLSEIARGSDASAFERLYQRHEAQLFSVAMNITRDRAQAEEAVQAAMLGVWRSAGTFEGSDSALRAWLLQIVARASLDVLRTAKRQEVKKMRAMNGLDSREQIPPSGKVEKEELLIQLRRLLEGLPDQDRRIVALHFGGALSQREIAAALRMPRRTIAYRIETSLKAMRASLAQAGWAAAVPLLSAETLSQAICSGFTAAPNMYARVLERVTASGAFEAPAAANGFLARLSFGKWMGVGAVLAGSLLAGAGWMILNPSRPTTDAKEGRLDAAWDFSRGPAQDLEVLQGEWHWTPIGNGGHMSADPDQGVWVKLPLTFPRRPTVIRIVAHCATPGKGRCMANYITHRDEIVPQVNHQEEFVPYRLWEDNSGITAPGTFDATFSIYCFDQGIVTRWELETKAVQTYARSYPARKVVLYFRHFKVRSIAVRTIEPGAIPASVRALDAQIKRLGVEGRQVDERGNRIPVEPNR